MSVRTAFYTFFLASAVALAGCAREIPAPSLAPRAVEKQPIDMPVTNGEEGESPADAELVSRIAALLAAAEAGDRAFAEQRARVEGDVTRAAGTSEGSDPWIAAQQALTSLDAARGPVRDAAAAIDALRANPAYAAPGNRAAIDQAAARIAQIDQAERVAFALLGAKLD